MADIIPIGVIARRVVEKTARQIGMDSPVVDCLRASIEKMTAQEHRDLEAERGRAMIEKGLRLLRDNAGPEVAISYLHETLLAISGTP